MIIPIHHPWPLAISWPLAIPRSTCQLHQPRSAAAHRQWHRRPKARPGVLHMEAVHLGGVLENCEKCWKLWGALYIYIYMYIYVYMYIDSNIDININIDIYIYIYII